MKAIKIMTYNIENMKLIFSRGEFAPGQKEKVAALENIIMAQQPHILGIVEAADKIKHHQYFLENTRLKELDFQVAKSVVKRPKHDLVIYYRKPFEVVSIDEHIEYYREWIEDIDQDGIQEVCKFERKPLEVLFRIKGTDIPFLVILVATKSKGVFSVNDLVNHQHLALANRKRLLAESKKIRNRIDQLMVDQPDLPLIVMGDFNDEPGMDSYERMLGASSIDTVMGSVFEPDKILHDTHWYMTKGDRARELWTTEYPDLIVQNFGLHRAWLDHIFISRNLISDTAPFRYKMDSGDIIPKDEDAKIASDHYAISAEFLYGP